MITFIDEVIERIKSGDEKDFSSIQVVFPTRRACLIFKNRFAAHFNGPQWLPSAVSIEDFILSHSLLPVADDLLLLAELYKAFSEFSDIQFDDFYQWGKILLNDFDETDSNLVDQQKLYATLQEQADISNSFAPGIEELELITEFWKSVFTDPPSDLRKNFIENWSIIPKVISAFKKRLAEQRISYRGLAYRHVAEAISSGKFSSNYSKILFTSFYALSKSEELIIESLINQNRAEVLWDADNYYLEDNNQEAGWYLRKNNLIDKNISASKVISGNYFESIPKNIQLTGIPLRVGQAKYLGELLQQLSNSGKLNTESTVVVLPDENMLFPVLYALPQQLKEVNVTMGFPAKSTALFSFVNAYVLLLKSKRKLVNIIFGRMEFTDFIFHPYVKNYLNNQHQDFFDYWNNLQLTQVDMKLMCEKFNNEFFQLLMQVPENFSALAKHMQQLITILFNSSSNNYSRIEEESIKYFRDALKATSDLLEPYSTTITLTSGYMLLRDMVKSIRIPFTGEPVKGLQIMGFLETRVLDFERVIILSVNEGFLPAVRSAKTYIPYALRKAYGLPTDENQFAIYAYHFYRLLQRANEIHLIYNTELKSNGGGEPSRYLLQIEHELKNKFTHTLKVSKQMVATPAVTHPDITISITKNKAIQQTLQLQYLNADPEKQKAFTASALNTYILCHFKFYLKYVAHLKETEEVEDNIDAAVFGNILHAAMEKLYEPGEHYTAQKIKSLFTKIDDAVNEAVHENYSEAQLEGKNLLLKTIITQLVNDILKNDTQDASFKIEDLENEYKTSIELSNGINAALAGFIDRIDLKEKHLRILDYKTGKVTTRSNQNNNMQLLFEDARYKAEFQLLLYAYIVSKNKKQQPMQAAFYALREINSGLRYLNNGESIPQTELDEFEERLKMLLNEIFNEEIPFAQTDDWDKCTNCAYKIICNRN